MSFVAIGMIVSGVLLGLWAVMKQCTEYKKKQVKYSYLDNASGYERLTEGDLKVIEAKWDL